MALFAQPISMTVAPPNGKPVRWGQLATGSIAILMLALMTLAIGRNQSVQWSEIPRYMIDPVILGGVILTLELTAGAMVAGIIIGCLVAVMATSQNIVLKAIAVAFVWWFRGVPLIVQIFFWFNIALFVPEIGFGSWSVSVNDIVTPAFAGFLALGLHEAANMSEIIRSGLTAVDRGQREAASSLGLRPLQTLRTVVLPQAIRLIVPPTGNQAIGMLKASAIVSVIGMQDLLTQAQAIYARNFLVIELLCVASLWYLGITTIASIGQHYLERKLAPKGRSNSDKI
ncbi:ABC transporter permease [Agrobacterium tumefaciens]|jgi:polar amino acid transport system permease protein|uniref:Glutamate/aspartate import permease protein GltK n=1 Tax=Agrobacterium fabrum (strain C58 / ATCC 33970) TaxID=176299 RepID=A9CL89_AGRFC|nr:amino acid ABC transporter permease [Agrobacterium fabrum]KEY51782.1 ABC transporter permease [Agrobacterium tumefaciens]AAK90782.1 ABC transporter, membrane spanning protein (amino acid) [Agrobacterium fabrum str. C58]KJX90046.1 ABC transporter permease protein [Agrobacterium tumefaciens]MCX2878235.1 amino acid ABC transporter permease [Agrobacterium fabrum]NMV72778.1 amino acid ABC transporter permease [Agrobacterium fabrum]